MNHQAFLFDFDGVLSKGRFCEGSLLYKYSEAYDWIQKSIFSNHDLVGKWMRGIINSDDINKIISENTETDYNLLKELYEESVRKMKLEEEVLDLAKSLKNSGAKIGIVTDNMDVFSQITVRNHNLDSIFDVIINSADYGILKRDDNGRLFDIALDNLGEKIENSL